MLLTGSIGNVDRYLLLFDTVKSIGILCVNILDIYRDLKEQTYFDSLCKLVNLTLGIL